MDSFARSSNEAIQKKNLAQARFFSKQDLGGVRMTETPNQVKPVNDTLDDLLNNPFATPVDTLTTTQQAEINA